MRISDWSSDVCSSDLTDWSSTTGWRTERDLGDGYSLTADLSARYGWDKIAYSMWDTVNPPMGPDSPTHFTASDYTSDEMALNAHFVYSTTFQEFAGTPVVHCACQYRREGVQLDRQRLGPGERG